MSLFKKKISISQFIADAIYNSYQLYDSNIDKLLNLENADEFKVMDSKDKADLKELGYSLIISDLMVSSTIHFSNKISNETLGEMVGYLNVKYLKEVKLFDKDEINKRVKDIEKLFSNIEKNEGESDGTANGLRFLLCSKFSEMFSSGDLKDEKVEGKRFAAFKLAKAIVKTDLLNIMLKEFKIDFSH